MGFSRQEYWNGLPFHSPGDLLDPGIEPRCPTLWADSLPSEPPGKPIRLSKLTCLCMYTHTHRTGQHLKGEAVFVNQAYNPKVLPCQGHQPPPHLTLPHPPCKLTSQQPPRGHIHPLPSPLYPPPKILLKIQLTCHPLSYAPGIPVSCSFKSLLVFFGSFCICIPRAPGPLDCPLLPGRTCVVFTFIFLMGLKQGLSDERVATLSLQYTVVELP